MNIEILPLGTTATVANGSIEVTITAATIYAHGGIMYEVAYWKDGESHRSWIYECELSTQAQKVEIGFKVLK